MAKPYKASRPRITRKGEIAPPKGWNPRASKAERMKAIFADPMLSVQVQNLTVTEG